MTKSELLNAIWKNLHAGDEALKHCVAAMRKTLDDPSDAPKFVEKVHRRGYRFIGKTSKQNTKNGKRSADFRARKQAQNNRQAEAYERLTGIYHWFTEGYKTQDMQEAGALLKELS